MNTYYLKKLRKEACKRYRVIWDEDLNGKDIWRIRVTDGVRIPYLVGPIYHSKEAGLTALKRTRRGSILYEVRKLKRDKIYKKKAREYNKQLAKL